MKKALKSVSLADGMMILFLLVSLFCPVYFSVVWSPYAPDIVVSNLIAVGYIAAVLCRRRTNPVKERNLPLCLLALLICFNVCAFYVNWKQHGWYYGQLNVSISFLLFLTLLASPSDAGKGKTAGILIALAAISNLIGFIPYFKHYYGLSLVNGRPALMYMQGQYDELRYEWFYFHKSEYSFMLMLFLALIVTYRRRFPNKLVYYGSIGVMLFGLVIANTRTSMVAALAIFAGLILDEIRKKPKHIRRRYAAGLAGLVLVMIGLLYVISQRRDLLSLGSRTYIWEASIREILKTPYGLGREWETVKISIPVWPETVYNCHNVFLNFLLQFSIPAGGCIVLMLVLIIGASIKRKPCFLTLGIWVALLIPMNMDWCLLLPQLSIFLVILYYLFFYQDQVQIKQ